MLLVFPLLTVQDLLGHQAEEGRGRERRRGGKGRREGAEEGSGGRRTEWAYTCSPWRLSGRGDEWQADVSGRRGGGGKAKGRGVGSDGWLSTTLHSWTDLSKSFLLFLQPLSPYFRKVENRARVLKRLVSVKFRNTIFTDAFSDQHQVLHLNADRRTDQHFYNKYLENFQASWWGEWRYCQLWCHCAQFTSREQFHWTSPKFQLLFTSLAFSHFFLAIIPIFRDVAPKSLEIGKHSKLKRKPMFMANTW